MRVAFCHRSNDATNTTTGNGKYTHNVQHLHLYFTLVFFILHLPRSCLPQTKYSTRIVQTAYGSFRGIIIPKSGSMPKDVEGYLGIPYASAPAASLRFMPPLTPSHFTDVRVADKFGPACPQLVPDITNRTRALSRMPLLKYTRLLDMLHLLSNQNEDCLYLNVYLPKPDEDRGRSSNVAPLPIVVVLHGDSWEWGSGSLLDGTALASVGNLVVITLNYRLGILGFLQTSSQQGNFAIMDIVAALNWIRENAGAFGGDPNRVTLLGHRTGAVLANFLMLAPVATELFHRVILLSGSSLSPWSFQRHAKGNVRKIAQYFKCIGDPALPGLPPVPGRGGPSVPEIRDLGPCLRDVPLGELLSALDQELIHPRFISRLGPLIDSTVVKSDFVSEMKYDPNGHFSRIQLLVGSASIESFDELNTEDIEDGIPDLKRDRILRTLIRNIFVFHLNEIYSTVKNEYTDWEKPRKDFIDVRDSILSIMSDGLTVAPLVQVASMHSNKGNAKTYFLHFQYEPDHSVYPHRAGSISEDLLQFSMGHPILNSKRNLPSLPSYTSGDAKASSTLVRYLTNFIISGDPNSGHDQSTSASSTSLEEAQLPYWDSYDPVNQLYLELGSGEPRMRSHYRGHKMALWLNLIPQLHQSGGTDVTMLHHNFREEKADYYEGPIREQSKHLPTVPTPPIPPTKTKSGSRIGATAKDVVASAEQRDGDEYETEDKGPSPTLPPGILLTTSECPPNSTLNVTGGSEGGTEVVRQLATSHYHSYGAALGVTIGVGCCLLLLNLLIFLAIYQKSQSVPIVPKPPRPEEEEDEHLCVPTNSLCRHHHHYQHVGGGGYSYPAIGGEGTSGEEYEEDHLIQELRSIGSHHHHQSSNCTHPGGYLTQDVSGSSGFCSPPIPDPPPPPRSSIPPSLAGSIVSIASSISASGGGATGILRRPPVETARETLSTGGSMKKRVQIQEISV